MDWRIYFAIKPQGKISNFPTTRTRNSPKETAARCYISIEPLFTAAPRGIQTEFRLQGKRGFNCDCRGSFLTPRVCLSTSHSSAVSPAEGSVGTCWWNCNSTPKISSLQRKQRHNLGAEEMVWLYIISCSTSVGLWKTVWWFFHLPNANQSPFRALTHLTPRTRHCTTNTPRGAFPKHHQGAKHSDPTEFHTGELSLFMELSGLFSPSLPVSGYTWWSWRIILSNLPINNKVGEQ